jgi:hypothetical protein
MKLASEIVVYGRPKAFFDTRYTFNTIDIETIDNELFYIGITKKGLYEYTLTNFYDYLNEFFIYNIQNNHDILSWSKYDNTFIIKTLLNQFKNKDKRKILLRIGKITPLFSYDYKGFNIEITNIIKDNIIITVRDRYDHKKKLIIYNLKNLFNTDLETTAKNYNLSYYSKLGEQYHIINLKRFNENMRYRNKVIEANKLDNLVIKDIAIKLIDDFVSIAGIYPKTIYTAGSLARSYLLTLKDLKFNIKSTLGKNINYDKVLDYSMRAYHGGKIESYILGYVKEAKTIDIASAYPYALSLLPQLTNKVVVSKDIKLLRSYYYVFINCNIKIDSPTLIHPIIIASPINKTNISPYGYFNAIITKIEYDYLIENGASVEVIDFIGIKHKEIYPYKNMIDTLFNVRIETKTSNPSLSNLYKIILNSLYGITYELTDLYQEDNNEIIWRGYRAGDFFNPIIASYITAFTRTYLSKVSNNIINNGGKVYLNMTDSIIYEGEVSLPIFSNKKELGRFHNPTTVKDIIILGAGRYEYYNDFTNKYTIKSRGFSVKIKNKSFYNSLNLKGEVSIGHKTLITFFKATTNKYSLEQLGHLIKDDYVINPFNLGGKRIIDNLTVDLKKEYTTTRPLKFTKDMANLL